VAADVGAETRIYVFAPGIEGEIDVASAAQATTSVIVFA